MTMLQEAWHGSGLVTLDGVRLPDEMGRAVFLLLDVEDMDFFALRFGGSQGLVNAVALALQRIAGVRGLAVVRVTLSGRMEITLRLSEGVWPEELPAALVAALRGAFGAAKLAWHFHLT